MLLILVTGATGYIAQHIVVQLLEQKYIVVGTVRSKDKGEALLLQLQNPNFKFEIVKDVAAPNAFDEVLKKYKFNVVLHTASPFTFQVDKKDIEQKLLLPAVNGTNTLLHGVLKHSPLVEHVVVTSSYSAMVDGLNDSDPEVVNDERSWNSISWALALKHPVLGYLGLKTFAEKAVWEFVSMQKPHFTVNTVNPVYVFGPQAFPSGVSKEMNTSVEIINKILKLKEGDKLHKDLGAFVDVRNVAAAHLKAFQVKEANGRRLLLTNGRFTSQLVLNIVNEKFPELGLPKGGPLKNVPFCILNDKATRNVLGLDYVLLEKTVFDTVEQIITVEEMVAR